METQHPEALNKFEIREAMWHELSQHGLDGDGWTARINTRAKTVYGRCFYRERIIEVSWLIARLNPAQETYDTIKHEVAHALAGPKAGHGREWKQACEITGAKPQACFDSKEVATPWTYAVICDGCHKVAGHRNRKPKRRYFHYPKECLPELLDAPEKRELRWVHRSEIKETNA
jgi:predicted SprT family Zn-dependent metalloprotease